MTQLDVAEPFGHDIQKRSIESDRRTNKRNYYPRLSRVVGFCYLPAPFAPPAAKEYARAATVSTHANAVSRAPSRFSSELFACCVLYPVDGGEVFITLDFSDFFDNGGGRT
ncbi:hypothetical protein PtrM4_067340 [Pyrenophora tritici-repentis]|uniref:Uncharacterized protein n=1 Tax=Pyrenophora tritici-repentis TaxID=45151 RepID=A0A834VT69_9PLEO|nr:hypothetical protein PtrM4_067340 [Pyrenophora tritici-repentis]